MFQDKTTRRQRTTSAKQKKFQANVKESFFIVVYGLMLFVACAIALFSYAFFFWAIGLA